MFGPPINGIIACASRLSAHDSINLYERNKTPMVVFNRRIGHPDIPCIPVDILAPGVLHAVGMHGLRVPDDIFVVGCDGIAMATHSNPLLTTIEQSK